MAREWPHQIDLFGQLSPSPPPPRPRAKAAPRVQRRAPARAPEGPEEKAPDAPSPHETAPRETALDENAMAARLEESGRFRVLRRLEPRPVLPDCWPPAGRAPGAWPRLGLILDTETTGLDHAEHEVIELGMVAFTYDEAGPREVVGVFSALQAPSRPISAEITRITGITDQMVAGQRIDLGAVRRFVEPADLVIAHNARFDRPFCEKLAPGFDVKPWACSVAEVDWAGLGYEGSKLGYLVGQSGYFHTGHRAVDDCHALLEVLCQPPRTGAEPAFRQLLASAARTRLRLHALGSPFHTKDVLKARGYRWSDGTGGKPKAWWREVEEAAFEEEARFLEQEIYGGAMNAHVERLTACERYRA